MEFFQVMVLVVIYFISSHNGIIGQSYNSESEFMIQEGQISNLELQLSQLEEKINGVLSGTIEISSPLRGRKGVRGPRGRRGQRGREIREDNPVASYIQSQINRLQQLESQMDDKILKLQEDILAVKEDNVPLVSPQLQRIVERFEEHKREFGGPVPGECIKGEIGFLGKPGIAGPRGEKGDPGSPGQPGQPGDPGFDGIKGFRGFNGNDGLPGLPGQPGDDGQKGEKGDKGSAFQ